MAGNSDKARKASSRAQALIAEALDLLDAYRGSAEASVHLELALQELRKAGVKQG